MNLIFFVVSCIIWIVIANKRFYIIPENSTIANCPSQPCATFSRYLLNNSITTFASDFIIYFLPGNHRVITDMEMWNVSNISLIGINNPSAMLNCLSKSHIAFYGSYNITITNLVFNQCNGKSFIKTYDVESQPNVRSGLLLIDCFLCKVHDTVFLGYGLIGVNLIGNSYLNNITIDLYIAVPFFDSDVCTSRILFIYTDKIIHKSVEVLVIKNLFISGYSKNCRTTNIYCALELHLQQKHYGMTIELCNSIVHHMDHTVLHIKTVHAVRNALWLKNCTFTHNEYSPIFDYTMITITTFNINTTIGFVNCSFTWNKYMDSLISVHISEANYNETGYYSNNLCAYSVTNISFENCYFVKNIANLLYFHGGNKPKYMANVHMKHIHISDTITTGSPVKHDTIYFITVAVYMSGMINISENTVTRSLIAVKSHEITFTQTAIFLFNKCNHVINLVSPAAYIKFVESVNITFANNTYRYVIIAMDTEYNSPHPFCLFQRITNQSTASTTSYSISIIDDSFYHHNFYFLFQYFSHCKWLSTSVHYGFNPGTVNQHIIQVNNQPWHYRKRVCYCPQVGYSNCSIDVLGPIYPGQVLQLQLCIPGAEESYTMYAETLANSLPTSACKIVHQAELINTISSIPKTINFTIMSDSHKECELFLTAQPHIYEYYDAFYVRLLSCPVGFTLQNGVCKCDPLLPSKVMKCFIDYSAIQRPADTWITAHIKANDTKYSISDCPMDYCLPYSSQVNLLHPDLQCQFNRTGILCSQCQHHLSMVFGSSRCVKCTNLYILITIIVLVAGIVLVVLLYLLNLTITIGTINGIIFYANIISINDSVFLVNDSVFKPLRVFISFVNLDLGIETCFYNGMDSYAKMWLQLLFPFYLVIIAVSIIIGSRYSSKILRLTYTRSLPVLATLFLLSYTGVLRTVLTVLLSYSTITHLPSGHKQIVWSIDASVPLFGLKFTVLFITCLVLLLLLIPFNIILLFTRCLLQFRIINRFKPLLDAFQGSYKDKYYYIIAVYLVIRSLFFTLYAFQNVKLKLIIATVILVLFIGYHGYIHPNKNKLVNIQELLLLTNLTILYAVSYHNNGKLFSVVSNIMISLAFVQFCTVVFYHFLTYTCNYNILTKIKAMKEFLISKRRSGHGNHTYVQLLNIPERTYHYEEYQDGLITDDFEYK